MKNIPEDLQRHLEKEHHISPVSAFLKEIVYGGTDGIVTTFAVVGGFAGAQSALSSLPIISVVIFGLANLFADGTSMGLSNFLSLRSEKDLYRTHRDKELHEVRTNPKMEAEETIEILVERGFTKQQAQDITKIYSTNEQYWTDFMMNYELELPNPESENPFFTASATFAAFIIFGFIPLIPYLFLRGLANNFVLSCIATTIGLLILGFFRWKVTNQTLLRSVGEIMLLGGVSASVAYFVGTFFRV